MSNLIQEVIERINYLQPGVVVESHRIRKNNQVTLTGITVRPVDSNIAPTIYIDQLLEERWSADDIALFVLKQYRDNMNHGMEDVATQLLDFDKIKDRLSLQLINWEANMPLWQEIPCTRFLDLAVIVVITLSQEDRGQATVKVTKGLLKTWGKIFEEVYSYAMQIFYQEKSCLYNMDNVLTQLTGEVVDGLPPMYVLTNEQSVYGAVRILDEKVLITLAEELRSDLIVIPSSVHECLLVPYIGDVNIFDHMVEEVNETQVLPEEVLSNHIYVYGRDGGWYNK